MRRGLVGLLVAIVALALAQAASGASWRVQGVPIPVGMKPPMAGLGAVSCTSGSACTAVGNYYVSLSRNPLSLALVERWDGTSWTVQPTPSVTGANQVNLTGVSCDSPMSCTAVGHAAVNGVLTVLAEHWDGTSWSIEYVPRPGNPHYEADLWGVSCTSASACTAVGEYYTTKEILPFAERWNGTAWSLQTVPHLHGAETYTQLSGVSCVASECIAVGEAGTGFADLTPIAARWNGTSWGLHPLPAPSGATSSRLEGVACPLASECFAVGTYYSGSDSDPVSTAFAERGNSGTAWSLQALPTTTDSGLGGISCASSYVCTAVGSFENGTSPPVTVAERWNGTSWSIQRTLNPAGSTQDVYLAGVACSAVTACTAVGSDVFSDASPYHWIPLAEIWN